MRSCEHKIFHLSPPCNKVRGYMLLLPLLGTLIHQVFISLKGFSISLISKCLQKMKSKQLNCYTHPII
ncbi:hypothetical protein ACB092_01G389700 [Castanea dentata]